MFCCVPRARFGVEDHYTLVRRLGYGGEGEVWLARPKADGAAVGVSSTCADDEEKPKQPQLVALKMLRRGLSKWQVEAVAAEVQCLLELGEGHVNIIRPTELLLSRTHLALVTEYAPGGSLADYVKKKGKLLEPEASYFFRQVRARAHCSVHSACLQCIRRQDSRPASQRRLLLRCSFATRTVLCTAMSSRRTRCSAALIHQPWRCATLASPGGCRRRGTA